MVMMQITGNGITSIVIPCDADWSTVLDTYCKSRLLFILLAVYFQLIGWPPFLTSFITNSTYFFSSVSSNSTGS